MKSKVVWALVVLNLLLMMALVVLGALAALLKGTRVGTTVRASLVKATASRIPTRRRAWASTRPRRRLFASVLRAIVNSQPAAVGVKGR